MASNGAKVGRLPPIADLGLPQLSPRELTEIAGNGGSITSRDGKHSDVYSDKNLLLKQQDYVDSVVDYPKERKERSKQTMHDVVEMARSNQSSKGLRRKGQKKTKNRHEKEHSVHTKEKNNNFNYSQDISSDDKMNESSFVDKSAGLQDVAGGYKYDIEEGNIKEWHKNGPDAVATVSRDASELAEEITVHGSISIDSSIDANGLSKVDYRELAIRLANNHSKPNTAVKRKRTYVDYVLVFSGDDESELNESQRQKFERLLKEEGIDVYRLHVGDYVYVELCCSFERLCQEAEAVFLEMPLIGVSMMNIVKY